MSAPGSKTLAFLMVLELMGFQTGVIMMGFNTEAGWVLIGASMIGSVFVLSLAISVFQEFADSVPPGDDRTAQVEVAIGQLAGVVSGVVAPLSFLLWGVAFFNTLAWPILE